MNPFSAEEDPFRPLEYEGIDPEDGLVYQITEFPAVSTQESMEFYNTRLTAITKTVFRIFTLPLNGCKYVQHQHMRFMVFRVEMISPVLER